MNDSLPPARADVPPAYEALLARLVLPHRLEDLHRRLARAFELHAQRHADHGESTLRVLLCIRLAPAGSMRATELSEQLVKSTSQTSRLIDRAEANGLVRRSADATDRRALRVALTARGIAAIDAYVPHAAALLSDAFGGVLSAEEQRVLMRLIDRLWDASAGVVARLERPLHP